LDNPWEFIHKVRAGQPGTDMPSSVKDGWTNQEVVDVLAYSQTLPTSAPVPGSTSRGGLLYDKWWVVAEVDEPAEDNPVWSRQDTNTRDGSTTWRCKECHGWDYKGVDGAYGSGSHFTGFPGVFDTQEKSFEEILAQISGNTDPEHDFSAMGEDALSDLASFIVEGLVDVSPFINAETKAAVGGDDTKGTELYLNACASCHGEDGRLINFGDEDDPTFISTVALDNPWEFIHKVRAGQPGTTMPSAMEGGWSLQNVVDLLSFSQSLPLESP
jgi:thiosulfate dehydrogenase